MFSLLRRVRKKVLQDGSFGQYALYAIGEVVLIVVGILAALWIDGINQERELAEQEQFYLQGLEQEFKRSLVKLDTLIAVNLKTYDTTRDLIAFLPEAATAQDEQLISRMLVQALSYEISYNPNNSLLQEMINSGRLQALSDPELRQSLTSWESILESINRQESNLRSIREQARSVLLGPEGSVLALMQDAGIASSHFDGMRPRAQYSNLPLLKSREFENKMLVFMITAKSTDSFHYQPLRQEILAILRRIGTQLD